jgi:hypothetical protein
MLAAMPPCASTLNLKAQRRLVRTTGCGELKRRQGLRCAADDNGRAVDIVPRGHLTAASGSTRGMRAAMVSSTVTSCCIVSAHGGC